MQIIEKYKALLAHIDTTMEGLSVSSGSRREIVSYRLLDLTHYYALGTCALLEKKLHPPAFALQRILQESFIRGLWFLHCATEDQIDRFIEKDEIKKSSKNAVTFGEMIEKVEKELKWPNTISQFKKDAWGALNSYTHSGMMQVFSHGSKSTLEPIVPDEKIEALVRLSARAASIAFCFMLSASDCENPDEKLKELETLSDGWAINEN